MTKKGQGNANLGVQMKRGQCTLRLEEGVGGNALHPPPGKQTRRGTIRMVGKQTRGICTHGEM